MARICLVYSAMQVLSLVGYCSMAKLVFGCSTMLKYSSIFALGMDKFLFRPFTMLTDSPLPVLGHGYTCFLTSCHA